MKCKKCGSENLKAFILREYAYDFKDGRVDYSTEEEIEYDRCQPFPWSISCRDCGIHYDISETGTIEQHEAFKKAFFDVNEYYLRPQSEIQKLKTGVIDSLSSAFRGALIDVEVNHEREAFEIQIISKEFKGMKLYDRFHAINEALGDLLSDHDYDAIITPLTKEELNP